MPALHRPETEPSSSAHLADIAAAHIGLGSSIVRRFAMSRAASRRHFTLAATALAAPVVLPRASLGDDAKVDLVHLFSGADHPVQHVIRAFNDKGNGVTVVS